jgi:hypothetical protein
LKTQKKYCSNNKLATSFKVYTLLDKSNAVKFSFKSIFNLKKINSTNMDTNLLSLSFIKSKHFWKKKKHLFNFKKHKKYCSNNEPGTTSLKDSALSNGMNFLQFSFKSILNIKKDYLNSLLCLSFIKSKHFWKKKNIN